MWKKYNKDLAREDMQEHALKLSKLEITESQWLEQEIESTYLSMVAHRGEMLMSLKKCQTPTITINRYLAALDKQIGELEMALKNIKTKREEANQ